MNLFPDIDPGATKAAVERALSRYQIFILCEPEIKVPKITASWSMVPPSNTNSYHSSTEEAAIHNVDNDLYRKRYISKIQNAVSRLSTRQQEIIIKRYMTRPDATDPLVYDEMLISKSTYYREREKAFFKLAYMLHLEVFKSKNYENEMAL